MKKIIITGLLLFGSFKIFTQTYTLRLNADNTEFFIGLENKKTKHLDSIYFEKVHNKKDFVNGKNYFQYFPLSVHKPILFYGEKRTASLVFRGRLYKNIVLQYDTYLDQLIYEDKGLIFNSMASQVALNSDNISQFDMYLDHDTLSFRYYSNKSYPGFNLEPGFYESVYEGKCKYLIRHKSTRNKFNGIDEYWYHPEGFIRVGEKYVRISSSRQFVNLFGIYSTKIRDFITAKNIKIREADKYQISDILRFYDRFETNSH